MMHGDHAIKGSAVRYTVKYPTTFKHTLGYTIHGSTDTAVSVFEGECETRFTVSHEAMRLGGDLEGLALQAARRPDVVSQVAPELAPRSLADLDAEFVGRLAVSLDKLQFRRCP